MVRTEDKCEDGYHDWIPQHEEDCQDNLLASGHCYRMSALSPGYLIQLGPY